MLLLKLPGGAGLLRSGGVGRSRGPPKTDALRAGIDLDALGVVGFGQELIRLPWMLPLMAGFDEVCSGTLRPERSRLPTVAC